MYNCDMKHFRLRITADLGFEVWQDIEGFEGLYQVSTCGRVKSLDRNVPRIRNGKESLLHIPERILIPKNNGMGYLTVCLQYRNQSKYYLIHRLVAQAFLPNPNNYPEVNHKSENKKDNTISNIEFCDRVYNVNYGTGRKRRQETVNRNNSRGAEKEIVKLSLEGKYIRTYVSSHEAAKDNNIKYQGNIINCCKGRTSYAYGYRWEYLEDYKTKIE